MGKKKQRRMSKSAAVYIPIGVLLTVLLVIVGTSGFLRVTDITVDGATSYSDEEIIAISGISIGDNLLFLDLGVAERRIQVAMPFINTANVSRIPPDSVRIEVTESNAIAALEFRNTVILIDSTGRVLKHTERAPAGLIEIWGLVPADAAEGSKLRAEQGGELQLQYMIDVLAAIEREGIQQNVSYLDVGNISSLNFGYMERFRVMLGGPNNLRQKLSSLPGAIAGVEDKEPGGITGTLRSEPDGKWRWTPDN